MGVGRSTFPQVLAAVVGIATAACPPGDGGMTSWEQKWNGTYYARGNCGSVLCVTPLCAVVGTCIATMCGCAPADQSQGSTCPKLTCTDVPFTFPTSNVVVGTLP